VIAFTTVLATALAHNLDCVFAILAGQALIALWSCASGALVTVLASVTGVAFVIFHGLGQIVLFKCVRMTAVAMELASMEHAFVTPVGNRMIVPRLNVRQ
jgi:hypothetical protein